MRHDGIAIGVVVQLLDQVVAFAVLVGAAQAARQTPALPVLPPSESLPPLAVAGVRRFSRRSSAPKVGWGGAGRKVILRRLPPIGGRGPSLPGRTIGGARTENPAASMPADSCRGVPGALLERAPLRRRASRSDAAEQRRHATQDRQSTSSPPMAMSQNRHVVIGDAGVRRATRKRGGRSDSGRRSVVGDGTCRLREPHRAADPGSTRLRLTSSTVRGSMLEVPKRGPRSSTSTEGNAVNATRTLLASSLEPTSSPALTVGSGPTPRAARGTEKCAFSCDSYRLE